jgi:hypothetical protein
MSTESTTAPADVVVGNEETSEILTFPEQDEFNTDDLSELGGEIDASENN